MRSRGAQCGFTTAPSWTPTQSALWIAGSIWMISAGATATIGTATANRAEGSLRGAPGTSRRSSGVVPPESRHPPASCRSSRSAHGASRGVAADGVTPSSRCRRGPRRQIVLAPSTFAVGRGNWSHFDRPFDDDPRWDRYQQAARLLDHGRALQFHRDEAFVEPLATGEHRVDYSSGSVVAL